MTNNKEKFTYVGYNEKGEMARIDICIKKNYDVSVLLLFWNTKYLIPLSSQLIQKYELINRINKVIETKQEEPLSAMANKKKYRSIRHFPILLSYEIGNPNIPKIAKYNISIQLLNSVFVFPIDNINILLSSLKERMLFPGDKNIGLEVIGLSGNKNNKHYKAKCSLCGREIETNYYSIKNFKSCGCLLNRNFDSDEDRFLSHVDKQENIPKEQQIRGTLGLDEEPCWLWTGYKNKGGYNKFRVKGKQIGSHRYSYSLYNNKEIPLDKLICHRCDNRSCVNPSHLFEGTYLDNTHDMINKGREVYSYGEKAYNSKLTEKDVLEIRSIKGRTQQSIADEYGISQIHVGDIVNRKRWKHI